MNCCQYFMTFLKSRGNFQSFEANQDFIEPFLTKISPFEILINLKKKSKSCKPYGS